MVLALEASQGTQVGGLSLGVVVPDDFGFSTHAIMSPVSTDSFISSFPICMPFVSFSCLCMLAGASSMVLESSGERGAFLSCF